MPAYNVPQPSQGGTGRERSKRARVAEQFDAQQEQIKIGLAGSLVGLAGRATEAFMQQAEIAKAEDLKARNRAHAEVGKQLEDQRKTRDAFADAQGNTEIDSGIATAEQLLDSSLGDPAFLDGVDSIDGAAEKAREVIGGVVGAFTRNLEAIEDPKKKAAFIKEHGGEIEKWGIDFAQRAIEATAATHDKNFMINAEGALDAAIAVSPTTVVSTAEELLGTQLLTPDGRKRRDAAVDTAISSSLGAAFTGGDPDARALALDPNTFERGMSAISDEGTEARLRTAATNAIPSMANDVEALADSLSGDPDLSGARTQATLARADELKELAAYHNPAMQFRANDIFGKVEQQVDLHESAKAVLLSEDKTLLKRSEVAGLAARMSAEETDKAARRAGTTVGSVYQNVREFYSRFGSQDAQLSDSLDVLAAAGPEAQPLISKMIRELPGGVGAKLASQLRERMGVEDGSSQLSIDPDVLRVNQNVTPAEDQVGSAIMDRFLTEKGSLERDPDSSLMDKVQAGTRMAAREWLDAQGLDRSDALELEMAIKAREYAHARLVAQLRLPPAQRNLTPEMIMTDAIQKTNEYRKDEITGLITTDPLMEKDPEAPARIESAVNANLDVANAIDHAGGVEQNKKLKIPKVHSWEVWGPGPSEGSQMISVYLVNKKTGEPFQLMQPKKAPGRVSTEFTEEPLLIEVGPEASMAFENGLRLREDQEGNRLNAEEVVALEETRRAKAIGMQINKLDARHHRGLLEFISDKAAAPGHEWERIRELVQLDEMQAIPAHLSGELLNMLDDAEQRIIDPQPGDDRLPNAAKEQLSDQIEALRGQAKLLQLAELRERAVYGVEGSVAPSERKKWDPWTDESAKVDLEEMLGWLNFSEATLDRDMVNLIRPNVLRKMVTDDWVGSPEQEQWQSMPASERAKWIADPRRKRGE